MNKVSMNLNYNSWTMNQEPRKMNHMSEIMNNQSFPLSLCGFLMYNPDRMFTWVALWGALQGLGGEINEGDH